MYEPVGEEGPCAADEYEKHHDRRHDNDRDEETIVCRHHHDNTCQSLHRIMSYDGTANIVIYTKVEQHQCPHISDLMFYALF